MSRTVTVFVPALFALASFASACCTSACADSATSDKTAHDLEDARRAVDRKDVEIRAYQWQLATLSQQLRDGQARSDALQRELFARVQQLTAESASLSERLKTAESQRAQLAAAPDAGPRSGRDDGRTVDALRRVLAASDARNAQIVEELAHIARLLGGKAPPSDTPSKPAAAADVVDPWGFGSRK
jgi:septal ring factor EnvC (AmiA/AmiB activator)